MEPLKARLKDFENFSANRNREKAQSPEPASGRRPGIDIGNPDCPICGGLGFVGRDLPIDDPEFGRMEPCACRLSEITASQRDQLFSLSNLSALSGLTFRSFKPRGRVGLGTFQANSLEQAFNSAQNFAGSLNGWLLLTGSYGCGKTHLAAAIANQAVGMGISTLLLTVRDLLAWLRFSYGNTPDHSFEDRLTQIRTVPLLIMDDFGTQNTTPWAQEKLFQIINHRYINKLPTVITSNQALNGFEPRVRSRLQDPDLVTHVEILAPDYRNPADDIGHPELSSLNYHSRQTFGSFSFRQNERLEPEDTQSLREAFEIAKKFAESPQGWLVFYGPYGCGKTHLAAAIGNYQAGLGRPPLFVGVQDLLDYLRAAFSPNSATTLDRRFYEIRSTQLLILDDIGTESATPWAREKLYQLINHRYNAELPTVLTTANEPSRLDQRLFSRMSDKRLCKLVLMSAPTYTGGG